MLLCAAALWCVMIRNARRHERFSLTADLTIQPGEDSPARFGGKVFNVSKGGLAVFTTQAFAPGKLTGVDLVLPVPGKAPRAMRLFGVTRWMKVQPDGNVLGIELLADDRAGDYKAFAELLDARVNPAPRLVALPSYPRNGGFTMVELCIAMVIICLLVTLGTPVFTRAIEQARSDAAAASLKTIWSAQRIYWLEYHTYAQNLSALQSMDLIDAAIAASASNPSATYVYQVPSAADSTFTAQALRNGSGVWSGIISIDQDGAIAGTILGPRGQVVVPTQ